MWVRNQLDAIPLPKSNIAPQPTVIVADTTFWGRSYGVTVFRSPALKKNLWWDEVEGERVATYHYGRKILEEQGWTFLAAVVDGKRGLTTVFKDISVQICHFHQMKQVTKYLTRRPQTLAGQELRKIMLKLTNSNEKEFTKLLDDWFSRYKDLISQKHYDYCCKKWRYKNKEIRGAYMSMRKNLPYLFTYQKYPTLNIPNTTNCLDGSFSNLKKKLAIHHGLRKDRRYKVISEILH